MLYRNENSINADIKSLLETALTSFNISGWNVVQGYQPEQFSSMEKVCRFFTVSSNRDGMQGREYVTEDGQLFRLERWRERRRLQIDCLMKRKITDTVNTLTAVDVTRLLVAYFNGASGTEALTEKMFGRLVIENVRIPASLDNTEKFRLFPGFDLILIYDQEIHTPVNQVDYISIETKDINNTTP